jgi:hypothetical protein
MKDIIGVKCINSPKHPQDSMLPIREGLNRLIPVNHTKKVRIATKLMQVIFFMYPATAHSPTMNSIKHVRNAISCSFPIKTEGK